MTEPTVIARDPLVESRADAAPADPPSPAGNGWLAELRNLAVLLLLVLGVHSFVAKPFYIPSASMMPILVEGDRLVVSKYPYGWSFASVSFHLAPRFAGRVLATLPQRGDIVIVEPNGYREDYIKRVIGLPGDTIAVRGGRLVLNGVPVRSEVMPARDLPLDANQPCDGIPGGRQRLANGTEVCEVQLIRETLPNGVSYDTIETGYSPAADDFGPVRIPAGHLFLMGDNRDNSADGRFASGPPSFGLGGPVPFEQIGGRAEFITFSLNGTSVWYNPISWFSALRPGRAGDSLRPVRGRLPGPASGAVPGAAPRAVSPAPQPAN